MNYDIILTFVLMFLIPIFSYFTLNMDYNTCMINFIAVTVLMILIYIVNGFIMNIDGLEFKMVKNK